MEKIALGVLHELQIKASMDVGQFTAEFSIQSDGINLNIPLVHTKDSSFTFKIPTLIKDLLGEVLDYKIFVYMDNARFQVDDGKIKLVTEKDFVPSKINIVKAEQKTVEEIVPPITSVPIEKPIKENDIDDTTSLMLAEDQVPAITEATLESTKDKKSSFSIIQNIAKDIDTKQKLNKNIKDLISSLKTGK